MESLIKKKKQTAKIKSRIKKAITVNSGTRVKACTRRKEDVISRKLRISTPSTLAVAFNVHPLALYGFSISSNLSTRLPEKRSATGY